MTLSDLAERCENALGPDRELDILIWAAVHNLPVVWDGNSLCSTTNMLPLGWIDPGQHSRNFTPLGSETSRPLFTKSLDAAMTLAPDGSQPDSFVREAVGAIAKRFDLHISFWPKDEPYAEWLARFICASAIRAIAAATGTAKTA